MQEDCSVCVCVCNEKLCIFLVNTVNVSNCKKHGSRDFLIFYIIWNNLILRGLTYPPVSTQLSSHCKRMSSCIFEVYRFCKKKKKVPLQIIFFYWHYNPLWVLTFSVIIFHSALSLHCFLHRVIPIICISPLISTIHLFLGLPLILYR
jgi:hypothetical protein